VNINLKYISKSYHQGSQTITPLKDISFELNSGQMASLLGPSGSGKSTLFQLICGIQSPSSGEIWLDNRRFDTLSTDEKTNFRGRNIGIIFQNYALVPFLTAKENIMLPLQINNISDAQNISLRWLDKVGLANRAHHFPNQLSGGEQQRIAIARALCIRPTILLADEPTGQLDTETGQLIIDLMFNFIDELKITALIVTHDLALAQRCPRVLELKKGQLQL